MEQKEASLRSPRSDQIDFPPLDLEHGRNNSQPTVADETHPFLQQSEGVAEDASQGHPIQSIRHGGRESSITRANTQVPEKWINKPRHSRHIDFSIYILILASVYVTLALYSWITTCHAVFGLYGGGQTGLPHKSCTSISGYEYCRLAGFDKNVSRFRIARTVQTIVSVLTLPVVSAVCSHTAVVFLQQNRASLLPDLSIRQVMVLADRGWTDPAVISKLFWPSSHRKYASPLLYLGICLSLLGAITSPLQEHYLSIKTSTIPVQRKIVEPWRVDIMDLFRFNYPQGQGRYGDNAEVLLTRDALAGVKSFEPQPLIWQGAGFACNKSDNPVVQNSMDGAYSEDCSVIATFANLSLMADPFFAQLPNGYMTGATKQIAPRFNVSTTYEVISEDAYPTNCASKPGAFHVSYKSSSVKRPWTLQACMPSDLRLSPWIPVRDRQDISEQLFLNITYSGDQDVPPGLGLVKISMNTTSGYFELPNYENNQLAGPLLPSNPFGLCGNGCVGQWDDLTNPTPENVSITNATGQASASSGTFGLDLVVNKPPLMTIAMALFGSGSFIANRASNSTSPYSNTAASGFEYPRSCIAMEPLVGLLAADYFSCVTLPDDADNLINIDSQTAPWLMFLASDTRMYITTSDHLSGSGWNNPDDPTASLANAFTAAAYLAIEIWLNSVDGHLFIWYDLGADAQLPSMPRAAMISITVMLGIFLSSLLGLAAYASFTLRWTHTLDAFAMMRLGACMPEKVPLLILESLEDVHVLDEPMGRVGDATGNDNIGTLALGASDGLKRGRRYRSYD